MAQLRDGGVSDALIGRLCPEAAPKSPAGVETRDAGQWATKPISAPRLKTDSTSFVEKPTVIYVAVKPSAYFNFGYRNARETHFAFEIAQILDGNTVQPLNLYGYAEKTWSRPFFEQVSNELEASKGEYEYVFATLVVMYKQSRIESSTDHIEILAASRGEDRSISWTIPAAGASAKGDGAKKGGPADEQLLRDAKPHLAEWRAIQRKVGAPKIVSKELDQFETDRCSAVIEADAPSEESPRAKIRVFLEYRRTTDFWKLTGADSRIFL